MLSDWHIALAEESAHPAVRAALLNASTLGANEDRLDIRVDAAAALSRMSSTEYIDAMHQAQDLGWLKELTWLAGQSAMTAKLAIPGQ